MLFDVKYIPPDAVPRIKANRRKDFCQAFLKKAYRPRDQSPYSIFEVSLLRYFLAFLINRKLEKTTQHGPVEASIRQLPRNLVQSFIKALKPASTSASSGSIRFAASPSGM